MPKARKTSKRRTVLDLEPKRIKAKLFDFLTSDDFPHWFIIFSSKRIGPPEKGEAYVFAETNLLTHTIVIDPTKNTVKEFIITLIHEFLHILVGIKGHERLGDEAVEKKIRGLERKVYNIMAPTEISEFIINIFRAGVVWDE